MPKALLAIALTLAALGAATHTEASGSIGSGAGKLSPQEAYTQGKILLFRVLICNGCPLGTQRLDRSEAGVLAGTLIAIHEGRTSGTDAENAAQTLCDSPADVGQDECTIRMASVHYYLTRRFKLPSP